MDSIGKILVLIFIVIFKAFILVFTGVFLCLGFRLGGILFDKAYEKFQKGKAGSPAPVTPTV